MGSKNILFIILLVLLTALAGACTDFDDDFTTDSSHRLSFSQDTLSFDTLFSEFPTSTQRLKVYNTYDKPMLIENIHLANAQTSGFRMNVDGVSGTSFTNVELRAKDSMFIFVEATMKTTGAETPLWVEDSICFRMNGNQQRILLQAASQDVIVLKGKTITQSETLTTGLPYLIYDSIIVEKEGVLTLPPNTRLFFRNNAYMKVKGTLKAEGTLSQPVVFRGHRLDKLFSGVPYDLVPGQWDGIYFTETSFNNHLQYTNIRNTNNGLGFSASSPDKLKIKLENCVIHNASLDLFHAINCRIEAYNSQFSNAGGAVLYFVGGNIIFKHCTIANYFRWSKRNNACLVLRNSDISLDDGSEFSYPLINAEFHNSIFYGSYGTEVSIKKKDDLPFEHLFNYCMIKANGTDDENFVSTIWYKNSENVIQDPKFKSIGSDNYIYDFHIDSTSAARNNANSSISAEIPFDMDGNSRFGDEGPDRGAYEWVPGSSQY